jgi:hypothetical protein
MALKFMRTFFQKRPVLLAFFLAITLIIVVTVFANRSLRPSRFSASLGAPSATAYRLMPGETVNLRIGQPYIITCPTELPRDGTGPNPGLLYPRWGTPWDIDLFGTFDEDNRTVTGSLLVYEFEVHEFEQDMHGNTVNVVQNFIQEKNMSLVGTARWPGACYGFPQCDGVKFHPGAMYYVQANTGAYSLGQYGIGREPGGNSIPFTCNSWSDGCFTAGTKIIMGDGSEKSIEDVRVGDDVLGWDEKTGAQRVSKVTETYVRHVPIPDVRPSHGVCDL